jgi:site-specific DNA-adenine methylase
MSLGIPYMGSKRKLASDILHFITSRHNNIDTFYDLFGGGGSISFTSIRDYRFKVHYNELNKHIYSLVEYLKNNKELEPKFFEWVTREEFFNQINKSNEDADWFSGFVMSCWSFGNSQSSYLYGSDIENLKRLAHEFIVNGCLDSMREIGVDIPELVNIEGVKNRRIKFCKEIRSRIFFIYL